MGFRVSTLSRSKRGKWLGRVAIPADVRDRYGKREDKTSWEATLSLGEAQAMHAEWLAGVKGRIEELRREAAEAPVVLTRQRARALAGEWYRAVVASESGMPDLNLEWDWEATRANYFEEEYDDASGEVRYRPAASIIAERDALLESRNMRVTADSADLLLSELAELHLAYLERLRRQDAGAVDADPILHELPMDVPSLAVPRARQPAQAGVSIKGLFEKHAASGAMVPHTIGKWRAAINSLVDHLGHDDAAAVTRMNVASWFSSLIEKGLAVKTVRATYRAAAARVFKIAHGNGQIGENPVDRVEVIGPKAAQARRKDISDSEAQLILKAALKPQSEGLSERHALARRWVPWICAYTGARVGEITQMRASDIRQEDGVWVFHITPEAGSVKTAKARSVPIHSHLIEQGVLALARAGDKTPLFYDPEAARKESATQPQAKQLGSKLAKWVRSLGVTDVESPNHGWRHRWKSQARLHGVDPEARDVIPGHAPGKEGSKYGDAGYPLVALKAEIEKLPRYQR